MLRSENDRSRGDALTWLAGVVEHQGARFPVSSHVVPFLVALVDDPVTPDRESILSILRSVVLGDADLPFDPDFELGDILTDDELAEAGRLLYGTANPFAGDPPMELYEAASIRWAAEAYRAAQTHLSTIVRWLSDPLVAAQAAELVAYFPPTQEIVDGLIASVAPASANLTMGYLTGYQKVDTHLTSALDADPVDVRMTAAVALAFRHGQDLPGEALDVLVDVKPPPAPPGWDRSMRGFVTLALKRVGL
jgi:hypothetical protein